jgi:hypothetical protein
MTVCCKRCNIPLASAPPLWVKAWPSAPLGFVTLALAPEGHGCDPGDSGDLVAMSAAGWVPAMASESDHATKKSSSSRENAGQRARQRQSAACDGLDSDSITSNSTASSRATDTSCPTDLATGPEPERKNCRECGRPLTDSHACDERQDDAVRLMVVLS